MGTEKRRFEIYVKRGIPIFFGGGADFRVQEIGGVVDQNVEAAEFVPGFRDEPVDVRFFREVGLDADGAAVRFGNFGGYFPGIGLRLMKMDDDIGAVLRQVKCDGAAQALARTGNQGNLSSEVGGIRIGGRHRQIKKVAYSP